MASTGQKGKELWRPSVDVVQLPLTVRVLTINGKRMTSMFYKQLIEKDLIDEEPLTLRGTPLGYFHLHSKECPALPHKHVLWGTGTQLHLATVIAREDDARYQKHAEDSLLAQRQAIHLLALVLALAGHPSTITWEGENRRKIQIAGYTLYTSTEIADQIEILSQARTHSQEDMAAWKEGSQNQSEPLHLLARSEEQQRIDAEQLLSQLTAQGIEIAHPRARTLEGNRVRLSGYYEELHVIGRWHFYPPDVSDRTKALFSWRVKDRFQPKSQQAPFHDLVASQFSSNSLALRLRWLLAERMMQAYLTETQEMAEELAKKMTPQPKKTAKKKSQTSSTIPASSILGLDPDHIWRLYEQESKHLKEYARRWDALLEECHSVEQLFLVP